MCIRDRYDDVLNRQREAIYSDRRHILEGDDIHERVQSFLSKVIEDVIDSHTGEGSGDDWDFDALGAELKTLYPISITIEEVLAEAGEALDVNMVTFYLDGEFRAVTNVPPFRFEWSADYSEPGAHEIRVEAMNRYSNPIAERTVSVIVAE